MSISTAGRLGNTCPVICIQFVGCNLLQIRGEKRLIRCHKLKNQEVKQRVAFSFRVLQTFPNPSTSSSSTSSLQHTLLLYSITSIFFSFFFSLKPDSWLLFPSFPVSLCVCVCLLLPHRLNTHCFSLLAMTAMITMQRTTTHSPSMQKRVGTRDAFFQAGMFLCCCFFWIETIKLKAENVIL